MKRVNASRLGAAALCLLVLSGCAARHYQQAADREAYAAIANKSAGVRNMDPHFTIEETNTISLVHLPVASEVEAYLGPDGELERDAHVLNLEEALEMAIHHSRDYQAEKERLYLSALQLTLARHEFSPVFSAQLSGRYSVETEEAVTLGVDEITGDPKVIVSDNLAESHRVSGAGTIGATWLIRDLGRISTAFTTDALRFMTGDMGVTSSSQLSATFVRPLLQNAGFKQQMEALTQAERSLLYDLRDFAQYRKDFSVQVAAAYYGVLGNRDAVRNTFLNLESSRRNAERTRAMVREGRITSSDLGRYEQQELSAEAQWVGAVRSYKQSLDDLKFQLGLSVEANIILDDDDLAVLEIIHPEISVDDSIEVALAGRMDFLNVKDAFEDAERRVELAANLLKPRLDLAASASVNSNPDAEYAFTAPQWERYRWNAGLELDPGLDRKSERNSYRSALIDRNRAARLVVQQEDQIKLRVRQSWRTLDQARRDFEISEVSVQLAERRVEEQELLADIGRAQAQDQVDAQNALIDSRNQRTRALVTHTIARLQFWNNLGILYIKDNGSWENPTTMNSRAGTFNR